MIALHLVGGVRHAVLDLGLRRAFIRPAALYRAAPLPATGPGRQAGAMWDVWPAPGRLEGHWELGGDGRLCCRWRVADDGDD